MATFSDVVKTDYSWKLGLNKSRSAAAAQFYEETIPAVVDIHAADIYAESIPSTPPASTSSVVKKWYPSGESGDDWIVLTMDRKVPNGQAWVALNSWNASWSSGSGDVSQILKNFVSPKYGPGYTVRVFDGSNNEIPILDDSNWIFDYKSGVLTFETTRSETGSTSAACIKIKVYQYVGKTISDVQASENIILEVEQYTLSATNITNKYVTLAYPPKVYTEVTLDIIGGPAQEFGVDFEVLVGSQQQVTWNGKALESLLLEGDIIRVTYIRTL